MELDITTIGPSFVVLKSALHKNIHIMPFNGKRLDDLRRNWCSMLTRHLKERVKYRMDV